MQKPLGFFAKLRHRPAQHRRIAGTMLYLLIAGGIVFLWGRSFSTISLGDDASSDRGAKLLSPFENLRDELARAGDGFATIARAVPELLQKIERTDEVTAPTEITLRPSEPAPTQVATSTKPTPEPSTIIAPPRAASSEMPPRMANVEPVGIAAETVLVAIETPPALNVPELRPSTRTASLLAASAKPSALDPFRNILLTLIRAN